MNIATIHAADQGGGAERSVLTLHRSLQAAGHCSRLYVGYQHLAEEGVEAVPRIRPFPGALGLIRRLEAITGLQNLRAPGFRHLIRSLPAETDVLHLHSLWGSGHYADIGGIALAAHRYPTVLTLRDEWLLTGHCAYSHQCTRWRQGCGHCPDLTIPPAVSRDATRINVWRKRRALHRAPLWITTVSAALKRQAERSPITAGLPIRVIYNGIDLRAFQPGCRREARAALGLPQDRILVLLTGQSIEGIQQGIAQQGARALERVQDPRVVALLVGHSAQRVASTLRVPSVVVPFQTTPEAMASCYRAADLTLVTSEVETFGRVAAESLACGTPVISSDAGGLPEVVPHRVGGWVVPNRQVEGFEAALRQLLADELLRSRLAQGGLEWVRARFADDHITGQYLELYQEITQERSQL